MNAIFKLLSIDERGDVTREDMTKYFIKLYKGEGRSKANVLQAFDRMLSRFEADVKKAPKHERTSSFMHLFGRAMRDDLKVINEVNKRLEDEEAELNQTIK
eukprot:CAMPEP_0170452320 /NCGR_PEP_ID=MMETSP0123-20130129/1257_1 /TAXON_ID=182087 /ORGANISM="Favella ehrenbergii, Strain Fehren 1" /LENGTH=100 /DNA_ID=CAMNT_0010714285 /DNA_START=187 /DNA_END=489 /DNA_ORIENTATION=-